MRQFRSTKESVNAPRAIAADRDLFFFTPAKYGMIGVELKYGETNIEWPIARFTANTAPSAFRK